MKLESLLLLLLLAISQGCGSKTATTSPEVPALAKGESASWRVEVLSAKERKDVSDPLKPNIGIVSPKVRVTYLGSAGSLKPPAVHILYSFFGTEHKSPLSGVTFEGGPTDPESTKILEWLMIGNLTPAQAESGSQESRPFEHGKKFSGVLDFRYPRRDAENVKLVFADVPPIALAFKWERTP